MSSDSITLRALRHGNFVIGAGLTSMLSLVALVSLLWTPWPATEIDILNKLRSPSSLHWLGTDHLGRDIFSMLMVGSQNSITVGIVAVAIGLLFGVTLGALAAARGGWIEEFVMRLTDFSFAFPIILSAIMITAILGPGTINSILAIGIFNIPLFARVTRGSANVVWRRDFVLAARAAGKDSVRISIEHVIPNMTSVIIVQATIQFAVAILAEAALSYLGLGTQPPEPSWGRMLNDAQTYAYMAPHLAIFPGLAIVFSVLGLNLLGDGMRDLLDPKLARMR
jgi:peptide/nickel transport system permease protein